MRACVCNVLLSCQLQSPRRRFLECWFGYMSSPDDKNLLIEYGAISSFDFSLVDCVISVIQLEIPL